MTVTTTMIVTTIATMTATIINPNRPGAPFLVPAFFAGTGRDFDLGSPSSSSFPRPSLPGMSTLLDLRSRRLGETQELGPVANAVTTVESGPAGNASRTVEERLFQSPR
jgi:hypothetical protein